MSLPKKDEPQSLRLRALNFHQQYRGKIEIVSKAPLRSQDDLSLAYTPGVAEPCKEIHRVRDTAYEYTSKSNMVAVVTDGTAVLGLGDIGPAAALPVMEGKAVLFKMFAGVDAFPICLDTKEIDRFVETVKLLEPSFGGINLEDISAPRCFEIEARLRDELDIPVFHDDQHGTAIVTAAAVINALRLVEKDIDTIKIVVNGAGSAGIAVTNLLMDMGARNIILCDREGAVYVGRKKGMNPYKEKIAATTNPDNEQGDLRQVMRNADLFIGVSGPGLVDQDMVRSMNKDPIIMAMANPDPEIDPAEAREAGAKIIATGRSDYPNQINNVLVFPGVFRGALDVRARRISENMKKAAALAIANLIDAKDLNPENIIPLAWDERVAPAVARAVAETALRDGHARVQIDPSFVEERTYELVRSASAKWQEGEEQ